MTTAVNNNQSLTSILQDIDLGPTMGSVQLQFAKLQLEQAQLCKDQATKYMDQIKQAQEEQKQCADMIARARKLQNEAKSGDKCTTMPEDMVKYFEKYGLTEDTTGKDHLHNKDEWQVNIESLTKHQETIGTNTQQLMVFLQDFISQYNGYLQGANTQVANAAQVLSSVARGQ